MLACTTSQAEPKAAALTIGTVTSHNQGRTFSNSKCDVGLKYYLQVTCNALMRLIQTVAIQ